MIVKKIAVDRRRRIANESQALLKSRCDLEIAPHKFPIARHDPKRAIANLLACFWFQHVSVNGTYVRSIVWVRKKRVVNAELIPKIACPSPIKVVFCEILSNFEGPVKIEPPTLIKADVII